MDLCGPMPTESQGGNKYFLSIIDDYSRKVTVFPIRNKSDVFHTFIRFQKRAERFLSKKVIAVRTDGGLEFCNKDMDNFLTELGIKHEVTNSYTPEMNGVAERFNLTALDGIKTLRKSSEVPHKFWGEALLVQFLCVESNLSQKDSNKTPFEKYSGRKPSVLHLNLLIKDNIESQGFSDLSEQQEALMVEVTIPNCYKQAIRSRDASKWRDAMHKEINVMMERKVWDLVDHPDNIKILENRCVYTIKYDENNKIVRYKARLVAQGNTQLRGESFDEVRCHPKPSREQSNRSTCCSFGLHNSSHFRDPCAVADQGMSNVQQHTPQRPSPSDCLLRIPAGRRKRPLGVYDLLSCEGSTLRLVCEVNVSCSDQGVSWKKEGRTFVGRELRLQNVQRKDSGTYLCEVMDYYGRPRLGAQVMVAVQSKLAKPGPLASWFSEQLLDFGNGRIQLYEDTQYIQLPENFCNIVATKDELIKNIFPDLRHNYTDHAWLRERAILAAKNLDVDAINFKIQQSFPGNEITFKSIDTVVVPDEVVNYPVEFLNLLGLPGMAPHNLRLKIGSPIIVSKFERTEIE
ncbi:retrovirus-related Pol polyprotein from transposon TNT 1-94 [Trichonephila clavipes]|uniref:Retrovirus-related Pol polyprotein from transposon TNT 1-94 n=1 Tax=Trichonephila clavipes TaxID=2585209 RepID=A0A8X6VWZ8_TRICX|nr:retrovirus-related Pol polyprotein from transposon TNT 1-94 [Trichonephila clavipes]